MFETFENPSATTSFKFILVFLLLLCTDSTNMEIAVAQQVSETGDDQDRFNVVRLFVNSSHPL